MPINLNIGCGDVYYKNWINIDIDSPKADLVHDLRKPLPFKDNSVSFIYNEHFIEHLTLKEGLSTFKDFYRVLKPNGVLRIATPDLNNVIFRYFYQWKKQNWIKKYGYDWIRTRGEMINMAFHEWEHKYLYNFEDLKLRLKETGFKSIKKEKLGKSKFKILRNLETRPESKLIVEATK